MHATLPTYLPTLSGRPNCCDTEEEDTTVYFIVHKMLLLLLLLLSTRNKTIVHIIFSLFPEVYVRCSSLNHHRQGYRHVCMHAKLLEALGPEDHVRVLLPLLPGYLQRLMVGLEGAHEAASDPRSELPLGGVSLRPTRVCV